MATVDHPAVGVNGERNRLRSSLGFSEQLGVSSFVFGSTTLYKLAELRTPSINASPRRAESADIGLVTSWLGAFATEVPSQSPHAASNLAERRVNAQEVWLWEADGEPASLAAHSGPAAGVARVGPVYTPPRHRRHGYGAAVTARASQAAIDTGAHHVMLYTDQANPTSNSVYRSIGYVADHDGEERTLGTRAD
jgi:predicted GNAT family acetyltransferase